MSACFVLVIPVIEEGVQKFDTEAEVRRGDTKMRRKHGRIAPSSLAAAAVGVQQIMAKRIIGWLD
eukprot:scaffold19285_cov80-Skeletonema_marinoi.AAC.6